MQTVSGNVRLLRASWTVAHGKAGGILARRQDLPEKAFIGVEELKSMFGEGNEDGVLPPANHRHLVLLGNAGTSDGAQLREVVKVLEREVYKYAAAGFRDMGIFWDALRPRVKLAQTKALCKRALSHLSSSSSA
eukprot:6156403-Prymnesium_polylepis.3